MRRASCSIHVKQISECGPGSFASQSIVGSSPKKDPTVTVTRPDMLFLTIELVT